MCLAVESALGHVRGKSRLGQKTRPIWRQKVSWFSNTLAHIKVWNKSLLFHRGSRQGKK